MATEIELELEELAIQLTDMLGVALYFAGAKKPLLQDAIDGYIEEIDAYFVDEDGEMGMDEIIEIIVNLKKSRPELFL
ncbi:MAG: hypothetical protein GX780_01515 [Campylobacteraceae bacterium]|nr:hypothetical protein [Campylobacteraceae bacterium]